MESVIEPSSFDLIVLGTGLPQCIIAAAAASNGHSVLHIDPCDFYGSHWASLPLKDFSDWCASSGLLPFPSSPSQPRGSLASEAKSFTDQGLLDDGAIDGSASIEMLNSEIKRLAMETVEKGAQAETEGSTTDIKNEGAQKQGPARLRVSDDNGDDEIKDLAMDIQNEGVQKEVPDRLGDGDSDEDIVDYASLSAGILKTQSLTMDTENEDVESKGLAMATEKEDVEIKGVAASTGNKGIQKQDQPHFYDDKQLESTARVAERKDGPKEGLDVLADITDMQKEGLAMAADTDNPQKESSLNSNAMAMREMGLEAVVVEPDCSMYSNFHFMQSSAENLGLSRSYSIDLAGPKLAFCGGPLVELLLRSGASNYLEFKGLEASFIWSPEGLSPVPSSRADVFKDRTLGNAEKRHLMRFFKLVVDHASSNSEASQISEADLESSFAEFLQGRQLPSSVQAIILYAIASADYKQDSDVEDLSSIISTREGMQILALYLTSVGRFPNAMGAFLYPLYGQGELPQAFSRCAAVKGALYVLRMPVDALLRDKETHEFKGLRMPTGQLIFCQKLVTGPSLCTTLCKGFTCLTMLRSGGPIDDVAHHEKSLKVVRSICIIDKSLKPDLSPLMVVFPPQSLTAKANGVVRALQLGSSASVCPEGRFLVQLSMACSDELVGIEALQAASRFLFVCPDSHSAEAVVVEDKPTLLWAVFYVQHGVFYQGVKWVSAGHIAVCGMPDETLDYRSIVASAENVFQGLYPADVFFPRMVSSENDVGGVECGSGDAENYTTETTETS